MLRDALNFIAGEWVGGDAGQSDVINKFSDAKIASVHRASVAQLDLAVRAARVGFRTSALSGFERYGLLMSIADRVLQNRDELASLIVAESGVPWKDSDNEVARTAETFRLSAEEGRSLVGDMVPIQGAHGASNKMAFTLRVPRGVVGGISAFNSPLNMAAHKIAPALAAGNAVVFKPPLVTPLSATRLFELMIEAGVPTGLIQLVQGEGEIGRSLVEHPDIDFLSFTGSTPVGRAIQASRGMRAVALELGSIAATIVCGDADLDRAATRCAQSAFRRQGQACTSTQRLFVERSVLDRFVALFLQQVDALKVGDPADHQTDVGPMISEREARRAEAWSQEAIEQGGKLLRGGRREGALFWPTVLTDVQASMKVVSQEVFAPVVSVIPFDDLDAAIDQVNATEFGLAAGLFTRDLQKALNSAARIHTGVVHLNDASSSRVDLIPFGGVKDSGVGVEGPRYAIREMTEERLVTVTL